MCCEVYRPATESVVCSRAANAHCGQSLPRGTTNAPLTALRRDGSLRPHKKECFSLFTYTDKTLSCVDCNTEFSFTASDQQFYADRQFSEPRRCPACRAAKKAARGESSGSYSNGGGYGGGGGGGYSDRPREMFSATCDSCGKEARVPFRPTGTKPVYCSDCFRR
ncbi:MAG: zinc-ribbon domain containing protein [Chloroflexi bacterium]|nr:zinc-ribbon domain containing protein [Chloroflexota bacterium]